MHIEPDFDRFVEPHEPHYFRAQARGFALLSRLKREIATANRYAGNSWGVFNHQTEEWEAGDECDAEFDEAMTRAEQTARLVARSNGYRILRAQGRDDEAARLVCDAHASLNA